MNERVGSRASARVSASLLTFRPLPFARLDLVLPAERAQMASSALLAKRVYCRVAADVLLGESCQSPSPMLDQRVPVARVGGPEPDARRIRQDVRTDLRPIAPAPVLDRSG